MKKYLALSVGYKQLLIPFDSAGVLSSIEKIIICDEKGHGKEKRYEEDKEADISLTVVDESKIVFSESELFDAVKKATAEAEKADSNYWKLYVEFNEYKKQNPPQAALASVPTGPVAPGEALSGSIGNDLLDALIKVV